MYAANEVVDLQERDYFNLHKFFKDGNTPQGNMSQYILDEQRSDANKLNASTTFQSIVSDHLTVHAGLTWQQEQIHYFRTVKDLLGGDYYINLDRFVLSTPRTLDALYNPAYHASVYDVAKVDLDDENIVIREGDTYGWDYNINGQQFGTWLQGQFSFRKVDFFLAGQTTNTTFWRTGNMRNGKFPENSLGDSEKQDFINYSAKAGITYKIDGRNYIYANGAAITRPPDARIAYASPRNQDQLVPGLTTEKVLAWEAGFQHRSPGLKARATFFYSNINDGLKLNRFFLVEVSRFGTYVLSNVDRRHAGVELAFQAKITPTLSFTGAAAIGEYIYTSRPDGFFIIDEDGVVQNRGKSYLKNFYVPSVPQTALSGSLEYRSPKFWSASLTVNYFNRTYLDFSPERRTEDAVFGLEEGDELYNSIVNQQKAPDAFSVDLFAFKSFKVSDGVFFSLTGGVTNLLNAEIVQGGYEQLRFERNAVGLDVFPPRYFYAFGTNFFLMGALRF
jgi:hypothetical protein